MQIPVQVSFKDVPVSDAVEAAAWEHVAELERFCDRITSCRVVIAAPHRRHHKGAVFTVRVDLTVPGEEIVVNREPGLDHAHEDVHVAMRDAFQAVRRRLEDHARRVRQQVKTHARIPRGRIAMLRPEAGYGFIATEDGREVYFHQHALLGGDFAQLRAGDEVSFREERGTKGPQATSVRLAHPHRRVPAHEETRP